MNKLKQPHWIVKYISGDDIHEGCFKTSLLEIDDQVDLPGVLEAIIQNDGRLVLIKFTQE